MKKVGIKLSKLSNRFANNLNRRRNTDHIIVQFTVKEIEYDGHKTFHAELLQDKINDGKDKFNTFFCHGDTPENAIINLMDLIKKFKQ